LVENVIPLVVQINGRKRVVLDISREISENDLMDIIKKNEILQKYLINQKIKKTIFVKNKLVNLII